MVLGEAVVGLLGGLTGGVKDVWDYNRDNFLYDRRMRQETEIAVVDWRSEQAAQWREDVRDLTGLTERKMSRYMMVNTLQMAFTVALFCEGRLQPGTPHWLIHLYVLTLVSALMYFLLSVWLAMHASVVVACERTRLLLQFVRLPIPTWQQFENMRTSATAYETLGAKSIRVPFSDTAFRQANERSNNGVVSHSANDEFDSLGGMALNATDMQRVEAEPIGGHGGPAGSVDTWGLESQGYDVHELADRPLHTNWHVGLVKKAETHYQCHDAFARLSMAFGTNQLLFAISYFVLAYVSVGDGAPWPAAIIAAVFVTIGVSMVDMDVALTRQQRLIASVLMGCGPLCAAVSTMFWCMQPRQVIWATIFVPIAFFSHGSWLFFALRACQVQQQIGGKILPTKVRILSYLDVFGWIKRHQRRRAQDAKDEEKRKADKEQVPDAHVQSSAKQGRYEPMVDSGEDRPVLSAETAPKGHRLDLPADGIPHGSQGQRRRSASAARGVGEVLSPTRSATAVDSRVLLQRLRELDSISPPILELEPRAVAKDVKRNDADKADADKACPPARWQKTTYYTDFGTEVTYFYNPASGEVRESLDTSVDGADAELAAPCTSRWCYPDTSVEMPHALDLRDDASEAASELSEPFIGVHLADLEERSCVQEPEPLAFDPGHDLDRSDVGGQPCNKNSEHGSKQAFSGPSVRSSSSSAPSPRRPSFRPSSAPRPNLGSSSITSEETGFNTPSMDVETLDSDKHPWQVFRYATLLLVILWLLSLAVLFGVIDDISEFGPLDFTKGSLESEERQRKGKVADNSDGTLPDTILLNGDIEISPEEFENLKFLPEGRILETKWPHQSFMPTGLTSDDTGTRLVVSDDFGIYAGNLIVDGAGEAIDEAGPLRGRSLRGFPSLAADFKRVPHCTALEGKELKDIAIVCSSQSVCRVLVLHSRGQQLTECPLFINALDSELKVVGKDWLDADVVRPVDDWKIGADWTTTTIVKAHLGYETIESVGLDSECVAEKVSKHESRLPAFSPAEVGCVVIGTSSGRIVALRRHATEEKQLVPEWAIQQRRRSVASGTIHVFNGGFVAVLRPEIKVLQVSLDGTVLFQWRLPDTADWISLGGGGSWFYMLGTTRGNEKETIHLWQFPLPNDLKNLLASYRQRDGSSSGIENDEQAQQRLLS